MPPVFEAEGMTAFENTLSDGMGVGSDAADESDTAAALVTRPGVEPYDFG
eukprot:SAG22_NODE_1959_length_3249_cov_2.004762_5_plen_50_part_00